METHAIPRGTSLHPTAAWLREHGQRVAGPFGAMGSEPALFWTPVDDPNAAARMGVPGDTLVYGDGAVRVEVAAG